MTIDGNIKASSDNDGISRTAASKGAVNDENAQFRRLATV